MVEWITHYSYAAMFLLLMLGIVGLPIPDEALLTFVGYLIFKGDLQAALSLCAAFLGSASGISISYGFGRFIGLQILSQDRLVHLRKDHLGAAQDWIRWRGKYALPFTYFIPGFRHVAAIIAGSSGMTFGTFLVFASLGALFWCTTFIGAGYLFGAEWVHLSSTIHRTAIIIALASALVVAIIAAVFWGKKRSP